MDKEHKDNLQLLVHSLPGPLLGQHSFTSEDKFYGNNKNIQIILHYSERERERERENKEERRERRKVQL